MARRRFTIPISIVLFLAATLVGTYVLRKHILQQAMMQVAKANHEAGIRSMLDSWPCPVNARCKLGTTPLHWAAVKGSKATVSLLLARGADVNATDDDGMTPLHWAIFLANADTVEELLNAGADPNVRDHLSETPLHGGVMVGRCDILRLMLEKGADVNVANVVGQTPLHRATRLAHREVVELLLRAGAQVNPRDNQDKTPLAAAQSAKSDPNVKHKTEALDQIIELLRKHGAKE